MACKIIAEIGVNHNGSLSTALDLIEAAAQCGVDYVKFQSFKAEELVSETAPKVEYQIENGVLGSSQYKMLLDLELSEQDFRAISAKCETLGIGFMSTPFGLKDLDFLLSLGMTVIKIASGEITNVPLLKKAAESGRPVILSTGMSDFNDVEFAVSVLRKFGLRSNDLIILQCTSEYPCPPASANLRTIPELRNRFKAAVGLSDHTIGIEAAIAAAALGAVFIEKHLTLDRGMAGPDHKASATPDEMSQLVKSVTLIEKLLGSGDKQPSKKELSTKMLVRRSIVASRNIDAGEVFDNDNLTTRRPLDGICASNWLSMLGRRSKNSYKKGDLIKSMELT